MPFSFYSLCPGSMQKPVQGKFQGIVQAQNLAHPESGNHGSLPDAVELSEICQGDDQRNASHGTVKTHFHHRQGLLELVGNHLHDALSRQGNQVGGKIKENSQGNKGHADDQINQPHSVDHGGRESHQIRIREKPFRQQVGKIREIPKEGGTNQLENPPGLEILSLNHKLDDNIQGKNNDDSGSHG